MRRILNGWHKIMGYDVYVIDGVIRKGARKLDEYRTQTTEVFRRIGRLNYFRSAGDISVDAFRAGVRRGTIKMF